MNPGISVIVPAYNEEKYIGATLDSLAVAAGRLKSSTGADTEFIVVDNASTDRTEAVAREKGARVVFEPHRQIAAARNRGAKEAQGKIIVTCDADNRVSENLLERIHQVMSEGALAGGVKILPERRAWTTDMMFGTFDFFARLSGLGFGVIFTDRDTFWRVGGYPSDVYVGEDAWFVWNLKKEALRRKKKFVRLEDAYIVTSLRKIDEFGFLQQMFTYLKFLLFPWTTARRDSCRTWYEVRNGKSHRR